jgi:alkanesulfonate monooxygenase SsuD/methylene tetrahydromethanopterin reductase-like flavin-dependent oxidoreductase (luciferase family)
MDFGVGLMGYHGSWDDARFAEEHGFVTAGFVDSPLLGGDPFVCLGLAAQATERMRVGTFLAIPGLRSAPTAAAAIATVNRIAPGRTFLGVGTGFTGRAVFGMPRLPAATMRDYALECRALLDGEEVEHTWGTRTRPIRMRHTEGRYVDTDAHTPVYVAADGPKALAAAGRAGDGLVVTLQYSHVMGNSAEVFAGSLAAVRAAAEKAGREDFDPYTMWSIAACVLEEGESAVSERALEQVGGAAMMPFHAYACDPSIGPYLPPLLQDRLDIYEREVLARFDVPRDRVYQEAHRGHLSHLLPGEEKVLTEEIMRATMLVGTAEEIARVLGDLQAAGLRNVSIWAPPHLTREVVLDLETKVAPLLPQPVSS